VNLQYAKPEATDEECSHACRQAQIYEHDRRSAQGLDTVVGERGYKLSGGEKQRIGDRARDPQEPAAPDPGRSHVEPRCAFGVARAGSAGDDPLGAHELVIAHRLSTILAADRILVLEDGGSSSRGRTPSCSRVAACTRGCTSSSSAPRSPPRPLPRTIHVRDGSTRERPVQQRSRHADPEGAPQEHVRPETLPQQRATNGAGKIANARQPQYRPTPRARYLGGNSDVIVALRAGSPISRRPYTR
jgi:hypothetical protein